MRSSFDRFRLKTGFCEVYPTSVEQFNIHISIDEYDNVVVDYERKHFTNLEKIKIPLTYYIRGGETSLKIRKNDNVYVLDMILKEYEPDFKDDLFIITLIFDKTNLTYQTRKSRQNSKTNELVVYNTSTSMKSGFCFRDTSSHIDN